MAEPTTAGLIKRLRRDHRPDALVTFMMGFLGVIQFFTDSLRQRLIGLTLALTFGGVVWLGLKLRETGQLTQRAGMVVASAGVLAFSGAVLTATTGAQGQQQDLRPVYQSTLDAALPQPGVALAWGPYVATSTGNTIDWLLTFRNGGNGRIDHVVARAVVPTDLLVIVQGSVRWGYVDHTGKAVEKQQVTDAFFAGGLDLGTYAPGAVTYVRFQTVARSDIARCAVVARVKGFVAGNHLAQRESPADARLSNPSKC